MRSLLLEGGVAGHMNHLYDNPDLTFRKMKEIMAAASDGQIEGTEKTDGQNLQLSYDVNTNTARAARNKGNIKDGGLDAAGLAEKFAGRGEVKEGYEEIAKALETFERARGDLLPAFSELNKTFLEFLKSAPKDESLAELAKVFDNFQKEMNRSTIGDKDFIKSFSKSVRKIITQPSALEVAFNEAFAAFEETVGKLSTEEREEIFGPNANIYYNAEVQDPRAANLINYDLPTLTIHRVGHGEYNRETGKATDRDVTNNAQKLSDALDVVQGEREEGKFKVQMNAIRKLEALSDDVALNDAYDRLDSALTDAGISDNQTVGEYLVSRIAEMIDAQVPGLSDETKIAMMKRIFKEKGSNIRNVVATIPKEDEDKIAGVRNMVQNASLLKFQAIAPIEDIVHDFSVEMLKGVYSAFILDNDAEVIRLRAEVEKAIRAIEGSDSNEAIEILTKQMSKLKDVDNVSTAAEGFVFDYDDVTYKFTGNFAPVNQILGLFKYGRGNVPPLQKLDEQEGGRTVAVVPGAFKPPHKGHMQMVQHYADLADRVVVMISPLARKTPSGKDISFDVSKKIWNIYLRDAGLEDKVTVVRSPVNSPVSATYQFVENSDDKPELAQPGDTVIPGCSTKGGDEDRFKANFEKYAREGVTISDPLSCAFVAPPEALSARDFRAALDDGAGLERFIPQGVDPDDVLDVLGVKKVEEISTMAGGSVEGYAVGNKNKRSVIREEDPEDEAVEEVLNYLLGKGALS